MASLPRIITVDPTGMISQTLRAALSLLDRMVIQIDVPNGAEAIEEVKRAKCSLVITAWEADDMKGWELAAHLKRADENLQILILAGEDDPEMDEDTQADSPFSFMQRPIDVPRFMGVLTAAMEGQPITQVKAQGDVVIQAASADMGPVPMLNISAAQGIIDKLLRDLGAMAIFMATRTGDVLLEVGASGYLDKDRVAGALLSAVMTTINVKDMIGGDSSALQFYDGEEFDLFVLSVGLHHFLVIVFDGQSGNRQFGVVSTFGRRATNDIIALLGANAWLIERPAEKPRPKPQRAAKVEEPAPDEEPIHLEPAAAFVEDREEKPQEPEAPKMDAVDDSLFDADALFSGDFDVDDDLFSEDKLQELAKDTGDGSQLTFEEAQQLGLLK